MPYRIDPKTGKRIEIDPATGQPIVQNGMDINQPDFQQPVQKPVTQSTEQTPVTEPKPGGVLGFASKAADFLVPRAKKFVTKVAAGFGTEGFVNKMPGVDRRMEERQKQSENLIRQAKAEEDPIKRRDLLQQANDLAGKSRAENQQIATDYEKKTGESFTAKHSIAQDFREGLGVGGEVGTFLMPVGKLAQGAKMTARILQGAKVGAMVGALHGATDPETQSMREAITKTLTEGGTGFLTGGLVSSAFEAPRAAAKKFLGGGGGNKKMIDRLFRMTPSERAKFRKSTGGMDFSEEILTREGQNMSGMNYEQLLQHFDSKAKEAGQNLDELLAGSDKTISRQKVIDAIQKQIDSLAPEKGNVGTSGAIGQLQGIIEDLQKIPGESFVGKGETGIPITVNKTIDKANIPGAMYGQVSKTAKGGGAGDALLSLKQANEIKKQLQNLGAAAFSPNGKSTVASDAMAGASGVLKDAIEEAAGTGKNNPVKDANRLIQLYHAAKSAIEKTGDREANKISNDMVQKFIQMIPTVGAVGAGGAGYALGGVGGAIGGMALATTLIGGAGAARVKYLSPEVQTRLISTFSGLLKNQGVKAADAVATRIAQEISKQIARNATLAPSVETANPATPGNELGFQSSGDMFTQPQQAVTQPQGAELSAVPGQGQPSPYQQPANQPEVPHDQSVSDMVTIKNSKTGETRQVKRGDLTQYGLASDAKDALPGMPSKGEILAAMVLDAQKGGKNISKLNTLLDAYDKVQGKTELSASQKKRLTQLEQAQTTVDIVENLALKAGTGIGATAKSIYGTLPNVEGGAEEDLARVTDGLAKAIAATLASESGVATNQDITRWKGLMPKVTDTMDERKRALARLKSALANERERLSVPTDSVTPAPSGSPQFDNGAPAF